MKRLWTEFTCTRPVPLPGDTSGKTYPIGLCGLCGNTGMVDTVGKVKSPAGFECGVRAPCICPNGRSLKKAQDRVARAEARRVRKESNLEEEKTVTRGPKRWWMSWNETSEDYRPLTSPPNEAILGWWCSGYAGDDSYSTICAWVEAPTEQEARAAVVKDWPGKRRTWRFINEVERDWVPGDRFRLDEWSKKRAAL